MLRRFSRPSRRRALTITAWALSLVAVSAVSATAAGMITGKQIQNGSVTGVDIKNGSLGWGDLSSGTRTRLINRSVAKAKQAQGPSSANAPGAAGAAGAKGDKGDKGDTGPQGPKGQDAPVAEYGIAHAWLDRGAGGGVWASYATDVPQVGGIPGTTGGEFRTTCNNAAGCRLYVTASVISETSTADARFQAHIQITRTTAPDTLTSMAHTYCEASEIGSIPAPVAIPRVAPSASAFADSVSSPAPVLGQWWGSADCGGTPAQLGPATNAATTQPAYILPQGRYNIAITARFFA